VIANGSLHFGADVPTRHVIQIILEHCGIVIANRGAGKTTALLEYVAIRRFYKKTPPVAILSPHEKMSRHTQSIWKNLFQGYPNNLEPMFHWRPEFVLQNGIREVFIDELWSFPLETERQFQLLPIIGAVGTPDQEFEHCPRKPNGPNPSNGYGPTGLDIGQWSMAHRWKL